MKINIYLILIIALAAFLRFYQLGQNPPELYADEVSSGYNAYSILKTAKDEYGNLLPITFRAFGDYNPALSVYTLVPGIAVFGLNPFAVRFPSALMGTLTVLITYFLTKKLTPPSFPRKRESKNWIPDQSLHSTRLSVGNDILPLLSAFLLAISPWHLQFTRFSHEANFMVFFTVLGITLFLFSKNNFKMLTFSALSLALAINTYHAAKIWVPLLLVTLVILYWKQLIRWKLKLLLPLLILIISAIPIVTSLERSTIRARFVGIFDKQEPLKLFISGYLSHFSPNFLFVTPDNNGRHAVGGMGHLYIFELPLILAGIIFLIRNKIPHKSLIISWFLLAPIPAALSTPTPHALRSITFLPTWSILAAIGLVAIILARTSLRMKLALLACLLVVAIYNIATYFHLYYKHYPKLKAADWNGGTKEMVEFMGPIKDKYEVIALTNYYGHPYIFVLFYTKYDPATYHPQSEDKNKFDKFEFFGASWDKKVSGTALVVRPHWQKPNPPPKYIAEIYDQANTLVFRISEEQ